ncbi:MAG: hypothetical protein RIC38_03580 [Chromatocurvus sp.]
MVEPIDPRGIRPLKPLRPVKTGDRSVSRRRRRRDESPDGDVRERRGRRIGRHIDEHC